MADTRGIRLLSVDPDLGAALTPDERPQVERELVVPAVRVRTGPVRLGEVFAASAAHGEVIGAVVLDGVLLAEVSIGSRTCTRILGPGDLVSVSDDGGLPVPATMTLTAQRRCILALLDDRFLLACARWPRLVTGVLHRTQRLAREAFLYQAVVQLPRVEDRLLAALWCLADRWGHVEPAGVRIDLRLTHATLGRLTGARRPTVSLGLKVLADAGLLHRAEDNCWVLRRDSLEDFAPATESAIA